MEKDQELMAAVEFLRQRFGDAMAVVDHWESDPLAVGVARKDDERQLAYVSLKPAPEGSRFFVALEKPPAPGSYLPYDDAGNHGDLSLTEAADIVARHLGVP
jgi:hypothetical protein